MDLSIYRLIPSKKLLYVHSTVRSVRKTWEKR